LTVDSFAFGYQIHGAIVFRERRH